MGHLQNKNKLNVMNSKIIKRIETDTSDNSFTIYFSDGTKISSNEMCNKKLNEYEYVNHPSHYNQYNIEVIDMMERIWGKENTALWCEMTAFKYRMRVGTKPDNSIEQDLMKERWYLNKAEEIKNNGIIHE